MVSSSEDSACPIELKDEMPGGIGNTSTIFLYPSSSVQDLFNAVTKFLLHNPDSYDLLLVNGFGESEIKKDDKKNLGELFLMNESTNKTVVKVVPRKALTPPSIVISSISMGKMNDQTKNVESADEEPAKDDDEKVRESPTYQQNQTVESPVCPENEPVDKTVSRQRKNATDITGAKFIMNLGNRVSSSIPVQSGSKWNIGNVGYVGLVNQAMTCYLNSLLQALYMTPEFRNSLYKWEFTGSSEEMPESIPYQLQKLFVSLQTSSRSAVETSKLTKSFGWDASDSWQQHDIQELCRVMFDALEQKFKDTEQADFINNLYQGKLIDYVTCLECKTEKKRVDTFLDIPLPVRPFGSAVAYNSVAEAMHAFIQPETLEGNNQYFCDSCNKKCDAHKGLKFSHFPYILTLHLKRFDFDYGAMTRIKLIDRVEFPYILNINEFLCEEVKKSLSKESKETISSSVHEDSKGDDASFTDSVSTAEDEGCLGAETLHESTSGSNSIASNVDIQDDDEGIVISNGTSNQHENEKNRRHSEGLGPPGPHVYELFAIMIHSGSASGGHYYVYIKDLDKGDWFCFDDQSVSRITHEDISMTYGGGSHRGYYSGAHSSSTNAYMLMYRQIDKKRNQAAMMADEFPPHLKELIKKMQEDEEEERILRQRDRDRLKISVFCTTPGENIVRENKLVISGDTTLAEATAVAHMLFYLEDVVPLEQCQLVSYDSVNGTMGFSFDGQESVPMTKIYSSIQNSHAQHLYLVVRDADSEYESYRPGGVNIKVNRINMTTREVDYSVDVQTQLSAPVSEIRSKIAKAVKLTPNIKILMEVPDGTTVEITDDKTLQSAGFSSTRKIFVAEVPDTESAVGLTKQMAEIIEKFSYTITLYCDLPDLDSENMSLYSLSNAVRESTNLDGRKLLNGDCESAGDTISMSKGMSRGTSPQIPSLEGDEDCVGTTVCSDQSTSEDSSLADSDRTLVGDEADYCLTEASSASNSPPESEQPPCLSLAEDKEMQMRKEDNFVPSEKETDNTSDQEFWCDNDYLKQNVKIQPYQNPDSTNAVLVQIDQRETMHVLQAALALHMGICVDYVKIFRTCKRNQIPLSNLLDQLHHLRDKEHLIVRLERALQKGEYRGKVYQFLGDDESIQFLCDWILTKDLLVGEVKKQLLEELKRRNLLDIPIDRCRLRLKKWKTPGKILLDFQSIQDLGLSSNWELFLQELSEPENVTSPTQVTVLLKRFSNTNYLVKGFHEVTLQSSSFDELRETLHSITGIPLESLEFARPLRCPFTTLNISRLKMIQELQWESSCTCTLDDSTTLYYRDKDNNDVERVEHRVRRRRSTKVDDLRRQIDKDVLKTKSSMDTSALRRQKDGKALRIVVNPSPNSVKNTN